MNPYKVLNVSPGVSPEELKRTFYELAKVYHPDKADNEEDRIRMGKKFAEITWAYSVLKSSLESGDAKDLRSGGNSTSNEEEAYVYYLYRKASEFIEKDDLTSAISTLYVLRNMDGGSEKTDYMLGVAHLRKGEYHRALSYFREVMSKNPWNINALLKMAWIYEKVGLEKTALSMYRDVLKIDSSHRVASQKAVELEKRSTSVLKRVWDIFSKG